MYVYINLINTWQNKIGGDELAKQMVEGLVYQQVDNSRRPVVSAVDDDAAAVDAAAVAVLVPVAVIHY